MVNSSPTKSDKLGKKWLWTVAGLLVLVFFAILSDGSSTDDLSIDDSRLVNNSEMTPYTSVEHGFKIDFPGFPDRQSGNLDVRGTTVPYSMYGKEVQGTGAAYYVMVGDYTGIELDTRGSLEGAVNGMVQNVNGQLIESSFSTFVGLESIEAHYTAPFNGKDADAYVIVFMYDQKMYVLSTIDVLMDDFLEYATSFRFVQ